MILRGRSIDAYVVAQLDRHSVKEGENRTTGEVVIVVKFRKPVRGRETHTAKIELGTGKGAPTTLLKEGLLAVEESTGMRFEMFEVVDLTRQFLSFALQLGYRIKGFEPVATP